MSTNTTQRMIDTVLERINFKVYNDLFFIEMTEKEMESYLFRIPWPANYKCNSTNIKQIIKHIRNTHPKLKFIPYREKSIIKALYDVLQYVQNSYSLEDPIVDSAIEKCDQYFQQK